MSQEPQMRSLNPYLGFAGQAEEAFDFYHAVLGGTLEGLSRFSEAPPEMLAGHEGDANLLMHVSLVFWDGQVLMGSDRPASMGSVTFGDSVAISIAPESAEEGARIFSALAEGGRVTVPYERQFWGADYGMCTDRFGIHWMVNYAPQS
jgi:PhnB protein